MRGRRSFMQHHRDSRHRHEQHVDVTSRVYYSQLGCLDSIRCRRAPGTDQVSDRDHPWVGLGWVGLGRSGGINVLCLPVPGLADGSPAKCILLRKIKVARRVSFPRPGYGYAS